jgi:hypothetical protein
MDTKELTDEEIIKELGGTTRAAELCEVTPGAVSQWLKNGIPKHQRKFLRTVRPDLFAQPAHVERRSKDRRQSKGAQ